jgi:regulator of sigma E protease
MSVIITILIFIVMLVILVLAHEFGHYITAKSRGVGVIEFGIGFPPRIWGIKRGDTIYSINALPLGGFVKLAGEEDPKVAKSLASKGYGTRILVLGAGSLMNILLPLVLFSIAFMIPHDTYSAPIVVESTIPGSQSEKAGILAGDLIVSINNNPIKTTSDVQRLAMLNLGKSLSVVIKHTDSTTETVILKPQWKPAQGMGSTGMGIRYQAAQNYTATHESQPFWRAVPMAFKECVETLFLFKNEIVRWIIGASTPQVTGPVGMAELTGEVAKAGISPLFEFAAFISINLGIVNILPLPALDGGRIAFVLLEMVRRGRRISPKTEGLVHLAGFALLIALILIVTFGDIVNIVTSGSALP